MVNTNYIVLKAQNAKYNSKATLDTITSTSVKIIFKNIKNRNRDR